MIDRVQASLFLDEPVGNVPQVSLSRAKALGSKGIYSVRDLLEHYPRRYIDLSSVVTVEGSRIGQSCTICGTIHEMKLKKPRYNLQLVEISLTDATGLLMITCFRQPWLMKSFQVGDRVAVAGKVEFNYGFKRMTNPFIEKVGEGPVRGKIIPVHPACAKVSAAFMLRFVQEALRETCGCEDPLPLELRLRYRMPSRSCALQAVHGPRTLQEAQEARRRLAFEEVFLLELFLMLRRAREVADLQAVRHRVDGPAVAALREALPFALTDEQEGVLGEIFQEMAAPRVANHLLLGDVGTGKTVVAAFALAAAVDSGGQALFMAPTEVLASQHFASIGPLLQAAGVASGLLTARTAPEERARLLEGFSSGEIPVLIGTHALLEPDVRCPNLTLAVIDEQQRFGVGQREKLLAKGEAPDALYLTATPIPRTLALTFFGDMTLSYLHSRPRGTAPRTTTVLQRSQRGRAYDVALERVKAGEQVFIVCPLIGCSAEERDKRAGADEEEAAHPQVTIEGEEDYQGDNLVAAEAEAQFLQSHVFADYRVELLHGRMKGEEKAQVMERFRSGESQVLVSTTIIEVGVDVPAATVMIVEDADRFGLSQLHQLRGRVGRGGLPSHVFLVSASKKPEALSRLKAMEATDDGFQLADFDLSLRREGDILGNRQSGASALKLVNVTRDRAMIEAAHKDARALLAADPDLSLPEHRFLAREVEMFGRREKKAEEEKDAHHSRRS